ncbi:MAG TPA: FkbM family methyltransferase [Candidatus Acidoferrales bacterium]|nr:FkbM family methyltransferase [Candidatus Acidoferrales bacterium]
MTVFSKTGHHSECANPGEKLLSICIPTFNRASYLPETLGGLLPQLSSDVELLVYDTGSTDGTQELMERLLKEFPRLRFFSLDTRHGVDETMLLLLEQSSGEYVWFFGSDDVMKPGAVEIVRRRILESSERPALVYVNHEIVDDSGRLLIPSHVGRQKDREFRDGRRCAAWLGLHLGYISSCIFRRENAKPVTAAREFVGSLWLGLFLNLRSLSRRGRAIYIGQPLVSARRNPANTYDYAAVFFRGASEVFWAARRHGLGWFTIYRAMNKTVRTIYSRFSVAWRCDDPAELHRTFPVMLRICWMYPWFWWLIVPVRFAPSRLVRAIRDRLLARRHARNTMDAPRGARESPVLPGAKFRTLVQLRKFVARWGGVDRILKASPPLVSAYRKIYAWLRPRGTMTTWIRGHRLCLDLTDTVVVRSLLTSGEWEQYETQIFAAAVQQGMVVVDIGANIGHYALEAARKVGPAGKVIAFEPEPHNFELLCRNIEANHYTNIQPVRKALSNARGVARLAISLDNFGAHHIDISEKSADFIEVETLTLDQYFDATSQRVDVIKMDVEGSEMHILEGLSGLLRANPNVILFTEFWPGAIRALGRDPGEFLRALTGWGFHLGILDQETAGIDSFPLDHGRQFVESLLRQDRGKCYVDLLCLRGDAVQGPLGAHTWRQSPSFAKAFHAGHR